jgi:putative membrane protein
MNIGRKWSWLLYGLLPVLVTLGMAIADDSNRSLPEPDRSFIRQAAKDSLWHISLGELALKQAAGGDIRRYGEDMIRENQRIQGDLISLAQEKGISIEIMLDPLQGQTLDYLARERGAGFDRQYISLMIDEQEKSERLYREEADHGQDRETRGFAGGVLPWIDTQLKRARDILLGIPQPFLK